jgi:hypothetical protein
MAICEGRVGAVFAIEASRLARNGRDWHTLIEFCGLVGTVIVDERRRPRWFCNDVARRRLAAFVGVPGLDYRA